jgi:hypothetical protein
MSNLETLVDRWLNDPQFKSDLIEDPQAAVRSVGVSLTEEEWASLHSTVVATTDGELQARISKGFTN